MSASLLRVGVKIPNEGDLPLRPGFAAMARCAEESGFASIWTTDHIVQPVELRSPYPFTSNARPEWVPETPWFDSLVALSVMASATEHVELGLAVMVAALRDPVVTAKQLASIDAIAGGRVLCGVGAGWMAEEYDALGLDFGSRGRRLEEWAEVARKVWSGLPGIHAGEFYDLPIEVATFPVPPRPLPILVGGLNPPALRRAGRLGGWVGHVSVPDVDLDRLGTSLDTINGSAAAAGAPAPRITTRVGGSATRPAEVVALLPALADLGVHDVIVDVDWTDLDDVRRAGATYFG